MTDRPIDRVERLDEITTELNACESIQEVYDHAVTASERLIEFDASIVCTIDDGVFAPCAVNVRRLVPGDPLSAEDGIAGRTVRNGRGYVIDDLEADPDGRTTSAGYRSVLSIPLPDTAGIGSRGVFQCHAVEPGAFSRTDRAFGDLLVSIVSNALGRLRYETTLNEERDRFVELFENVPDPAVQYRVSGGRTLVDAVNSAFVRVFGYDPDRVIGEPLEDALVSEPSAPADDGPPELATTDDPDRRTDIEVVRETATGSRPFLFRKVPVATSDDVARGYLIYTDLTPLKARERELERKNERLDEFAGIVAHDLRNPLNLANGYLELTRANCTAEPDTLAKIADAHERMERLIDDVLILAREEGAIDATSVPLATVARTAWESIDTPGASLEVEVDGRIEADPDRLLRLLENLFRNSVEHGSPNAQHGSRGITVRVLALPDGFAVEDDGVGVPAERRDEVFDSGFAGPDGSTGLGLAIVRRIADGHGWKVLLGEGADGGARFEFTDADADWTVTESTESGDRTEEVR